MKEGPDLAGHLEHGRTPDKVPNVFCIQSPAYSIKPPHMEVGREPQLHALWKAS